MTMREFTFKYQNGKGGAYFLSAFFGVPFGVLFPSFFLLDYISWIFWISIPLMIGLIVYCIRQFIRTSKDMDTIQVDDEGFTSKSYGRVQYSDIHSVPPYGPLQAPPPSMRIKLHNGKKLVWQFNANHPKSAADVTAFTAFREELLGHLKQRTEAHPIELATSTTPRIEVIEQLEKHKKRDFNYKYVTIPFGFALAVLMFVRTCGEDLIREHKEKEFNGVRSAILHIETDYEENMQEALRVAAAYSLKFGPVLLLTNDPLGKAAFIPDIRRNSFAPEIPVVGLRRAEDNKQLEKFIQHPDSAPYDLVVINPSMEFSAVMNKSPFSTEDTAAVTVYFYVYNPHKSLPSKFRGVSDTTFQPIRYSTSISVPKEGHLMKDVLRNMDFASIRAILKQYEGTYFYMAAKENEGISPERFEQLKAFVLADFDEYEITTEQFESRRINTIPR